MTNCTCDTFTSATTSPALNASNSNTGPAISCTNTNAGNALKAVNTFTGSGETAYISGAGSSATLHVEGSGSTTQVIYAHSANNSMPYVIYVEGATNGILGKTYVSGGTGILGQFYAASGGGHGVWGDDHGAPGANSVGVLGSSVSNTGVYGTGYTIGVYGIGSNSTGIGVSAYGLGTSAVGLFATCSNTAGSNAGVFTGNVSISGTLSKSGGGFKIDHPQDPENKYLIHSFVEAPKATNIHRGEVVLDVNGLATVKLPKYWTSANDNAHVSLTAIGSAMPGLFSSAVVNGSFTIQGGVSGGIVNWIVMSDRADLWAKTNDPGVEVEKSDDKKGFFLNPEIYGKDQGHHEIHQVRESFLKGNK